MTASFDATVRLWDVNNGQPLRIFTGHSDGVTSVAFASDGKTILTGSYDKTARLWDAKTCGQVRVFTDQASSVTSVPMNASCSMRPNRLL